MTRITNGSFVGRPQRQRQATMHETHRNTEGDGARLQRRRASPIDTLSDPLRDAAGRRHRPATAPVRIVSLVPSLTELLFDLDLGECVVGRTSYCVHPRERVRRVARVGGTKTIDLTRIVALAPTHVVVNIDETPRDVAETLTARGCNVIVTHPVDIDDNLALYRLFGGLFGREAAAIRLERRFVAARDALIAAATPLPWRRVLYLIWKTPWMTVGSATYISRMMQAAHWRTMPDLAEPRYPTIALTADLLDTVDLVLFASEPFPFKPRHIADFCQAFPEHAAKAMAIDGQMISWYGSRAIAGLDYLRTLTTSTT
ncbi:MAG: helical backbone metal receptor [Hyphomicrobiales bacterium]